jgi:hypothetical protein
MKDISSSNMRASYEELKEEIGEMKRRIRALEKGFDAIATRDDLQAIEDGRRDLREGGTVTLRQAKSSH